jgi:hypothetical protein
MISDDSKKVRVLLAIPDMDPEPYAEIESNVGGCGATTSPR